MVNSLPQTQVTTLNTPVINPKQDYILAAIDIGTNSIHMVVVRIDTSLPAFTIITREKDTVRLGDRDPKTGNLTIEGMARASACLKRCQDLAKSLQADEIVAVATSAMREAPNGKDFIQRIYSELGLCINLISGYEEARRIYLGVLSGMEFNDNPHVIIDIGGGSTELILADSREARFLRSTKVGAVRLTQDFVTTDPISKTEMHYLQAYVRGMMERGVEELKANVRSGEVPRMVGTSGTIKTLAMIHSYRKSGQEPHTLNSYSFSREELEAIVHDLAPLDYKERFEVEGISDRRAEIIVPGAIILLETMKMLDLPSISICERALREGVIVDWMLTHGLITDKLRYHCSVRERSVFNIAHKYQVDLTYSERIAKFALSIFEQIQGKLHNLGDWERNLLWAATVLHNCGVYISHASHHKHSYYLIRNAELLGYTETEVELIANIARYHRKSKPKKKHDSYANLPTKEHQKLVKQVSAILRLAVALDRRQIGAIKEVNCEYKSHKKELHLHISPSKVGDDCALELWNLAMKKAIFEAEYDVKVVAKLK